MKIDSVKTLFLRNEKGLRSEGGLVYHCLVIIGIHYIHLCLTPPKLAETF